MNATHQTVDISVFIAQMWKREPQELKALYACEEKQRDLNNSYQPVPLSPEYQPYPYIAPGELEISQMTFPSFPEPLGDDYQYVLPAQAGQVYSLVIDEPSPTETRRLETHRVREAYEARQAHILQLRLRKMRRALKNRETKTRMHRRKGAKTLAPK